MHNHPSRPPLHFLVIAALGLLCCAGSAAADATDDCHDAIVRGSSGYLRASSKALGRCQDRVVTGALPSSTDCQSDPDVIADRVKADSKMRSRVERACGGADRACGSGGDDLSLASIGWNLGTCPDLNEAGCTDALLDCGDISDCLVCIGDSAANASSEASYENFLESVPSTEAKCQRTLGRESAKAFGGAAKSLGKCWSKVTKNKATAPCPSPGDGKTAASLLKTENKMIAKICKSCGGADRGCDANVGEVTGTGGSDDILPSALGALTECPDVSPPSGGGSCSGTITTLSDLAECVRCVGEFNHSCGDLASVPWSQTYPEECGGEAPEPPTSCEETVIFSEDFSVADSSPWPVAWTDLASRSEVTDVQGGQGRLSPVVSYYSLARMAAPLGPMDVEATFTVEFEDVATQGVGFYVRQNGGHLQLTPTHGAGYGVFVEGFRANPGIGLWKEVNGEEIPLDILFDAGLGFVDDTAYRVRFRVSQASATQTWLRGKIWPEAGVEPTDWHIEVLDDEPTLQGIGGGTAVDSWSSINPDTPGNPTPEHTFVDDIEIRNLCNPLAGVTGVAAVSEVFQFLEGPRWNPSTSTLAFTDVTGDTIYELTPPAAIAPLRTPSSNANGLANDINGDLLACEHTSRSLTRRTPAGVVTTVVDNYLGDAFNSPNDVAVRSDGTIYFTDPHYGLANPGDRELPFNGMFRRTAAGVLSLEFSGDTANNGPNGIDLSPDETVLYMTDTETGEVLAWDVAIDGSLSGQRVFASGLTIPDGGCVDENGNLFVATWGNTVDVFSAGGDLWGSIPTPQAATNCAFGGDDGTTLYVTAQQGLYQTTVPIPGLY